MIDDPPMEIADSMLARRMCEGDEESLRLLLKKYGGKVKAALTKRYWDVLDESEIDQAVLDGAFNVWRFADRFVESEGGLGGWFLSIAANAAATIIRQSEPRHRFQDLKFDPSYKPVSWGGGTTPTPSGQQSQLIQDLNEAIASLPHLQREVIRADLAAAEGKADSSRLARRLHSTEASIYAARSKAHGTLHRMMLEKGHFPSMQRGQR